MFKKTAIILLTFAPSLFVSCSSVKSTSSSDGSSIENAIRVKSVDQEYDIVRKLCPDCKLAGQGLTSKDGKHYDVIKMIKSDGTQVSYYFDINSFYGKW